MAPEATDQPRLLRYNNSVVALHWTIAALIIVQLWLGFTFHRFLPPGPERMEFLTWHKTVGALILLLTLIRLGVRLVYPPPPYPPDLPRWERLAAVWNHRAFYFLLIVIPLTGLIAVSGKARGPTTSLAGGLQLPVIPGITEDGGELSGDLHMWLVYATILLVVLHVGAALRNQFFERRRVSGRMPPFRPPSGEEPVQPEWRAPI
jgi:cytochrome b561